MNRKHSYISLTGILIAVLVILGTTSAAASSGTKITNCLKAVSRPTSVTLTCGDGNTVLSKLRWSSFGGSTAAARGTFETNTCKPNCASGKVVKYPVTIKASGTRSCKGGVRVYAKLSITFSGKVPSYVSNYKNWTFSCPG